MLTMGIDSGSAMTKAVLFDGQEIVDFRMEPSGSTPGRVIHRLYEELRTPDTAFVVATGYGRALLPEADKSITEITCHGAGAAFLCPGCDTVIDIGGQDSKVILLDPVGGQVKDFLMNDKCAAGTGRFLEMTMSRVGSDIASIDTFVEGAEPVTINSMCAVFAESEIIGLLAQETSRQHRSGVHLLHLPPHRYFCPEAGPGAPQGVLLRRTGPVAGGAGGAGPVSRRRERHCPSPVPV